MADYTDKPASDRYVRESTYKVEPVREGSGSALWFIIGGIVVALAVLFAVFYDAGDGVETVPVTDPAVTIENNQTAPAGDVDPVAPAPEADSMAPAPAPDATAPAESAPAPAETETAPTAPAEGN